jgi:hypothetical protein
LPHPRIRSSLLIQQSASSLPNATPILIAPPPNLPIPPSSTVTPISWPPPCSTGFSLCSPRLECGSSATAFTVHTKPQISRILARCCTAIPGCSLGLAFFFFRHPDRSGRSFLPRRPRRVGHGVEGPWQPIVPSTIR